MKLPHTLEILGYNYTILYKEDLKDEDTPEGVLFGRCEPCKFEIEINTAFGTINQESALIHEIIEATNSHAGLELNHTQICTLEATLYNVFKQLEHNEDNTPQTTES